VSSLLTACWLVAAAGRAAATSQPNPAGLRAELQRLLDTLLVQDSTAPGLALHLEAPRLGISWTLTAGLADRAAGTRLGDRHAYRMASNTKTYVAAAILRLWEQGRLKLDQPIGQLLSDSTSGTLRRGGYDPATITVRHLLTHTSGIFDWGDAPQYMTRVEADPMHRWSRAEQLGVAIEFGKPYGAPGAVYRYSDTGYNLLGEIIERLTGQAWAAALRGAVGLDRLGLTGTWLESLEPKAPAALDRAHQYYGAADTYDWDPSLDLWGGGGYAATLRDMAVFTRGLFTGAVYRDRATADTMLTTVPAKDGPPYWGRPSRAGVYRMGIAINDIDGVTLRTHGGFWGTFSSYIPTWDLAIAGVQTQQQARLVGRLQAGAIAVLKRHLPPT
jgi:D-alanyl-D-alanine carboxypeptidase